MRACYPVPLSLVSGGGTAVHTWVDVELRVIGKHVAVNYQESDSVVGAQSWSTADWVPFGVVIWHEPRCWGSQNNLDVARLLEDIVELVYMGYPLSVIWGLVHSFALEPCCPDLSQNCANVVGFLQESKWCLMIRRIRGRSLAMGSSGASP